ncbi:hypothetical protein R5R35_004616 [Gryllus longicercus]|uniref:C-type lectin domain-containing protein n=1 Tax=Gryllus longicercus TaxID=2509291 RepID=A0AAN9W6M0_9ORTH
MAGQRVLLLLLLATSLSTSLAAQPRCSAGKELALSLSFATNATGHRAVSANIEQPLGSPGWLLEVEVKTSGCGPDDVPRRSLSFTLNGPPEEGLWAPSPAPSLPTTPSTTSTPTTPATPSTPLSPSPSTPRAAPPGYLTLPGLGHYRAPPEAKDWAAARDLCREEGGGLLTPTSQREVELLFQQFSANATGAYSNEYFWHTGNDIEQEGKFVTADGVPLEDTGFAVFAPGNPWNSTEYNCLAIDRIYKLLYDTNCSKNMSFICKVPL